MAGLPADPKASETPSPLESNSQFADGPSFCSLLDASFEPGDAEDVGAVSAGSSVLLQECRNKIDNRIDPVRIHPSFLSWHATNFGRNFTRVYNLVSNIVSQKYHVLS